jgi:hypothetical protein
MRLANEESTYVNEYNAAAFLNENRGKYDGLTYEQVIKAHNDPGFLKSMEISGYGAIHLCENDPHKERIYVSLCHRHYTAVGLKEVISAQHRHALEYQKEANKRLAEHGEFVHREAHAIGKVDGFAAGHSRGLEAGKDLGRKPLISFGNWAPDFAGGFVDTFRYVGVVGVALVLAVVYLIFVKGKGIK